MFDIILFLIVAFMVWCGVGGYLQDKRVANHFDVFENGVGPDDKRR